MKTKACQDCEASLLCASGYVNKTYPSRKCCRCGKRYIRIILVEEWQSASNPGDDPIEILINHKCHREGPLFDAAWECYECGDKYFNR